MKKFGLVVLLILTFWWGRMLFKTWRAESTWGHFIREKVTVTAYSMNPDKDEHKKGPAFHGNPIVSQAVLTNSKDIELAKQTTLSLDGNYLRGIKAACEPAYRHGFKFEKDGQKVEALICFNCGESIVFNTSGGHHFANIDPKWLRLLNEMFLRNKMRLADYYVEQMKRER